MSTSLVNNKYRITRRIGGGSFGEIYMGIGPNNEKVLLLLLALTISNVLGILVSIYTNVYYGTY